jgi:hypothetical protein
VLTIAVYLKAAGPARDGGRAVLSLRRKRAHRGVLAALYARVFRKIGGRGSNFTERLAIRLGVENPARATDRAPSLTATLAIG